MKKIFKKEKYNYITKEILYGVLLAVSLSFLLNALLTNYIINLELKDVPHQVCHNEKIPLNETEFENYKGFKIMCIGNECKNITKDDIYYIKEVCTWELKDGK